jgi:tetratricopeptide (TPR) repeat protein
LRTQNIIFLGTASGIKSSGVKLGDVIVSDRIVNYVIRKLDSESEILPYTINHINPNILVSIQKIRNSDWQHYIEQEGPRKETPKCIIGPIALSNTIIKTEYELIQLINSYNKLIGINAGANIGTSLSSQSGDELNLVMIQGVSDLIDPRKNFEKTGDWRLYAIDVAASFAITLLKEGFALSGKQENRLSQDTTRRHNFGVFGQTEKTIEENFKIHESEIDYYLQLVETYQTDKRFEEALVVLRKILDAHPYEINACIELSKIYQQQKKWLEAEDILLKTLKLDPNIIQARIELSKIYQRQGKFIEAESVLLEVLDLDKQNLQARTELSKIYQRLGKWKEAEVVLFESLEIDNKQIHPRTELSKIYQHQRKLQEAEVVLLEALKIDSEALQVRLELSKVYQEQGNFEKSLRLLQENLALNSNDINSLMELGRVYARELENFEEAERIFQYIIQIDFDNIQARIELASLYLKIGRPAKREDILFQIYEINPQDIWILITLSKVFRRFRKYRIALNLLETALAIRNSDLLLVCELIELHVILRDKKNVDRYITKGREILDSDSRNKYRNRFTKIKIALDEKIMLLNLNEVGYLFKIGNESYIKHKSGNNYMISNKATVNNRVRENDKVFFATYKIEEEITVDFIEPFFESINQLPQLK